MIQTECTTLQEKMTQTDKQVEDKGIQTDITLPNFQDCDIFIPEPMFDENMPDFMNDDDHNQTGDNDDDHINNLIHMLEQEQYGSANVSNPLRNDDFTIEDIECWLKEN